MRKTASLLVVLAVSLGALTAAQKPTPATGRGVALGDWPDARGPNRDGVSNEKGLVEVRAERPEFSARPYGGRSAPIVMATALRRTRPPRPRAQEHHGARRRQREGRLEYKFNIYQSCAAPRRLASPAADPETGNLRAWRRRHRDRAQQDGKPLWERSVGEEFAAFTTHGGRTMSPLVDGNPAIVSAAIGAGARCEPRAPVHRPRQEQRQHRPGVAPAGVPTTPPTRCR
jgi:hypothetical protein